MGTDPLIPDLVNDGYLIDSTSPISHEQIYGNTDRWTKLSFYVKMNSAPGVNDGVLKQWINDVQFHTDDTIAWVTDDEELNPNQILVGWNYIAIGGNDYFQAIDNDQRFEDWYAIDNFKVFNGIPNAPAAPSDVIMTY